MDQEYLTRLCAARDILCGFCEADECDQCMVSHLINDAYGEMPYDGGSYTAFAYGEDGITAVDLSIYDDPKQAIDFAKESHWDEVVNDETGDVIWRRQ